MRNFLFAFALIILIFNTFAAVDWISATSSGITGNGVLLSGKAVFTSYDGNVYAVRAGAGPPPSWIYDTEGSIALEPVAVDQFTFAIATTDGRVIFLNAEDKAVRAEYRLRKMPYALAAGDGKAFVGINGSILALSPSSKVLWNATIPGAPGQIGFGDGAIYFTLEGKLYSYTAATGAPRFAAAVSDSFLSRPQVAGGTVYLGASDGKLYAINFANGRVSWDFPTGGWIMGSPLISGETVYSGSNDGCMYALSTGGNEKWRFCSGAAIWSQPVLSGKQLVFGNNAGRVFGLDAATGREVWSFSAEGRAYSPLENKEKGSFIFGTSRGIIYSLSSSPICSFAYPLDGDAVGDWPVDVEGTSYSDSGMGSVEVRLENGAWLQAVGAEDWYASVDFSGRSPGGYKVECRATDRSGRSETGEYASLTLIKQTSLPLQKMYLSAPSLVEPTENFTLLVADSRGEDLHGVTISIADVKKTDNSPFLIQLGRSGPVEIKVEKAGFEPASITVYGRGGTDWPLIGLVALIVLALIYFFVLKRFLPGGR